MRKGFTLIELSIVLVIIGLIIGGVMVGKDLIKAAAVRSQIADWQRVETAILTFKNKYNALPGDIKNAGNFFAGASNGDGSGKIDVGTYTDGSSFGYSGNPWSERCQMWYHLSAAKLITEEFPRCNGTTNVSGHTPLFKAQLAGDTFNWLVTAACATDNCQTGAFTGDHYIISQSQYNGSSSQFTYMGNNHWQRPAPFTVDDLRAFDSKIDDGNGLTGRFQSVLSVNRFNYYPAMITNLCTDAAAADGYKANYTERQCHFSYRLSF